MIEIQTKMLGTAIAQPWKNPIITSCSRNRAGWGLHLEPTCPEVVVAEQH